MISIKYKMQKTESRKKETECLAIIIIIIVLEARCNRNSGLKKNKTTLLVNNDICGKEL